MYFEREIEAYWDRVWEEQNALDAYDLASKKQIRDFVEENYGDELEEMQEESPYMSHQEIVDEFISYNGYEIREAYNDECRRVRYD